MFLHMALTVWVEKKNYFRDGEMQDYECDHFISLDK